MELFLFRVRLIQNSHILHHCIPGVEQRLRDATGVPGTPTHCASRPLWDVPGSTSCLKIFKERFVSQPNATNLFDF